MRRLHVFAALLLALVWLPATQHCGLEAAGVLESAEACCQHDAADAETEKHCGADNCAVIESGDYSPVESLVKITAPISCVDLSDLLAKLLPAPVLVPETVFGAESGSPPELRRTWQFVERAAPLARAPSSRVC